MKEKDFNQMLNNSKDMPKIQLISDEKSIKRYGGRKMLLAPPISYDEIMRQIPYGKLITTDRIRVYLAGKYDADFTDPMTAGIFISLAAQASNQRANNKTPFWRTLKKDGELNEKYPGGLDAQRSKLEQDGHAIIQRGSKLFVESYEKYLFIL